MSWSNNLLATHLLQPHSSQEWTNRSREATVIVEQDGKLTLLVILTTSTGLAIILLLLIFVRIGCLKGKICSKRRHKDSQHNSSSSPVNDEAFAKSAQQPSNQTTFVHTMIEHDTSSSYTIKLIDNDLIIETQESEMLEYKNQPSSPVAEGGSCNSTATVQSPDNSPSFKLQHWPTPCNDGSVTLLETKSLQSSPETRPQVTCKTLNEKPEPEHQSEVTHPPGFGFTQSHSCCRSNASEDDRHTYTYGNQLEYYGGHYGYVDPMFSSHYSSSAVAGLTEPSKKNTLR